MTNLPISDQERLIDLANDTTLQFKFKEVTMKTFWLDMRREYPTLAEKATEVLLPFASTYLCEASFSKFAFLKNKFRSLLDVEAELRVAVSEISPRIDILTKHSQAHPLH